MKQLLVKFKTCEQCSPDDWEMTSKEKLFGDDSKLSDIREWIMNSGGYKIRSGVKSIVEVQLSEPETTSDSTDPDDMPY